MKAIIYAGLPEIRQKSFRYDLKDSRLENLLSKISDKFKLSSRDILSKSRLKNIIEARALFIYIARFKYGYTTTRLASKLNCNHATIVHHCKTIKGRVEIGDIETIELVTYLQNI